MTAPTKSAAILTWQERLPLCPTNDERWSCAEAEIADLRAVLAAVPDEVDANVAALGREIDRRIDELGTFAQPSPVSAAPVVLVDRNAEAK